MTPYPKRLIEVDLPITRISARQAGEVDPARAHFDAAHLVGAAAVGCVPRGHLRGALARPCRPELSPEFSRCGFAPDHRLRR